MHFLAVGRDFSSALYQGHPADSQIPLFADDAVMCLCQNYDCLSVITQLLSKSQGPSGELYQASISTGGYVCAW